MKRNVRIGLMAAALSFANMSYADFIFRTNNPNACESLAGQWAGTGKAYNWLVGTCIYHGIGLISTLDSSGSFTVDSAADKDSGSFLCPNHAARQLTGNCINGVITVKTEYGNLTGTISANSGDAKGTLTISPGVTAEVTTTFSRVG